MSWTFTDFFCGFGGSSIGFTEAGGELVWAANHWDKAIETHALNFRNADHFTGDISGYDMRRVPSADAAWMSPECTWHSPAGGRKRLRADLDLFDDYVPDAAGERSRATMWDVVRAAEAKQFKVVVVENVVEVTTWPLFETWLSGMVTLGYEYQILCVSAAHVGGERNPHAPQWRDRIYFVFSKKGIPMPDVQPHPLAWCSQCEAVVESTQSWKRDDRRRIGKYGPQYVYVHAVGHPSQVVEPYVLPAAAAIDWSDLGTRIGDRERPLAPATMRRIEAGIRMFARPIVTAAAGQTYDAASEGQPRQFYRVAPADSSPLDPRMTTTGDGVAVPPFVTNVRHGEGDHGRQYLPNEQPLPTAQTKIGDGIVVPAGGTWNDDAYPTSEPLRTRLTRDAEGLAVPFVDVARTHNRPHSVDEPLAPLTTGQNQSVVVPPMIVAGYDYQGGDERRVKPADQSPLGSVVANGRGHHQLVIPQPFIAELRGTSTARSIDDPLGAITAGGLHHGLTVPESAFIQKHHGGVDYAGVEHMVKPVDEPLPSMVARVNTSLVVPYRRGKVSRAAGAPLPMSTTSMTTALLDPEWSDADVAEIVQNSMFRMLGPREHLRAQRFPDSYMVLGNKSEQTKGAGNAVASNVAHYLGVLVGMALGTPQERAA